MSPGFSKFILCTLLGWTITEGEDKVVPEEKAVILAAPHTSIWDFVVGYLYYRSIGGHLRTMIKKEAFFFPLGPVLRAMGGFPIDRSNPQKMVMSIIHEMHKEGTFHLVICPEGTRKAVRKWKTGYHTIATEAGIPVYLSHYDYKKKKVGRGQRFVLTGNARADTDAIQAAYEKMGLTALHPEMFTTR